jgi:MFS family permease
VRFVLGIGIGAKNATVPIFSSELAPARIRGALVMFWQLWVTFGASSPCFVWISELTPSQASSRASQQTSS